MLEIFIADDLMGLVDIFEHHLNLLTAIFYLHFSLKNAQCIYNNIEMIYEDIGENIELEYGNNKG